MSNIGNIDSKWAKTFISYIYVQKDKIYDRAQVLDVHRGFTAWQVFPKEESQGVSVFHHVMFTYEVFLDFTALSMCMYVLARLLTAGQLWAACWFRHCEAQLELNNLPEKWGFGRSDVCIWEHHLFCVFSRCVKTMQMCDHMWKTLPHWCECQPFREAEDKHVCEWRICLWGWDYMCERLCVCVLRGCGPWRLMWFTWTVRMTLLLTLLCWEKEMKAKLRRLLFVVNICSRITQRLMSSN